MSKKLSIIILFYLLLHGEAGYSQKQITQMPELKIGSLCPELQFSDVKFWHAATINTRMLRGKWFVLDFWNKECGGCIASFPETNQLQRKLGDKVQFFLVGYIGSQYRLGHSDNRAIRVLYERLRQRENLQLPIAYDSTNFKKLRIGACPYIVLVDDKGIIQAITYNLNETIMTAFLQGKHPSTGFARNSGQDQKKDEQFDMNKPLLVNGNGGNDSAFLFRSLLSSWTSSSPRLTPEFLDSFADKGFFQALGVSKDELYNYAYNGVAIINSFTSGYGTRWTKPILENIDSLEWVRDKISGHNVYCYSTQAPVDRASRQYFMETMQDDLRHYFGYKVRVETRDMPCLRLVVIDSAKIKALTHPEVSYYEDGGTPQLGFTARNYRIADMINSLAYYNDGAPPIINSTGITGNINLVLHAFLKDLAEVNKSLADNGLSLVKSYAPMKVIVVYRDTPINDDKKTDK